MRTPLIAAALASSLLIAACDRPAVPLPPASTSGKTPYVMTLDLKQLMNWVMDPHAGKVFAAVGSIVTEHGEEQVAPKTDEDWNAVRNSAATVLESGNLLMLDGRARDQKEWMARAKALSDAAGQVLNAVDVKDPEALFTAAGDLYQTCTDCHAQYVFAAAPPAPKN